MERADREGAGVAEALLRPSGLVAFPLVVLAAVVIVLSTRSRHLARNRYGRRQALLFLGFPALLLLHRLLCLRFGLTGEQVLAMDSFTVAVGYGALAREELRWLAWLAAVSLLQAGAEAHIPAAAMNELVKAFSYDIDFQREIHPGDTVEVLMDRKPNTNGGYSTQGGSLRYAALTLKGKKYEIFRYKDGSGQLAWFDGNGNSIRKSLLRTPVDAGSAMTVRLGMPASS